jgi:hypothetical protein
MVQSAAWIVPGLALAGMVWLLLRHAPAAAPGVHPARLGRMTALFGLFTIVYLIVLAFAQVFTFPPITLASRMLSPAHVSVLVLLVGLLILAKDRLLPASRLALVVLYLGLVGLVGVYFLRSVMIARDYHATGIGYNSVAWRASSTIEALRQIPSNVPLISNESTVIMYLTGRPAYALQEIYQSAPTRPFTVYGAGDDASQRVFREQKGALVLFNANLREDFAMYGDEIDQRLQVLTSGLYPYFQSEDGAIYFETQPAFAQPSP